MPVDRHVFVKRLRAWVNADGFLSPLDFKNLASFDAGPPAVWQFVANAGDGRTVEIELRAEMLEGKNTTVFQFSRPTAERAGGKQLPAEADVRLTVRFDIEDRNFHWETKRNGGADHHFSTNTHPLFEKVGRDVPIAPQSLANQETRRAAESAPYPVGFSFTPAAGPAIARICGQRRISSATGMVRKHPAPGRTKPRPDRQRRRLQSGLV